MVSHLEGFLPGQGGKVSGTGQGLAPPVSFFTLLPELTEDNMGDRDLSRAKGTNSQQVPPEPGPRPKLSPEWKAGSGCMWALPLGLSPTGLPHSRALNPRLTY